MQPFVNIHKVKLRDYIIKDYIIDLKNMLGSA